MKGFPIEFRAVNSDFSDKFPVSIIEAKSTANGRAIGINVIVEYHNNSKTILNSRPLPIKSSIYFHRNCINKITITIENVKKKGSINDRKINDLHLIKNEAEGNRTYQSVIYSLSLLSIEFFKHFQKSGFSFLSFLT